MSSVPVTYTQLILAGSEQGPTLLRDFGDRKIHWLHGLAPPLALELDTDAVISSLKRRFGEAFDLALAEENTDPAGSAASLPAALHSPVSGQPGGAWLKRSNVVGINVRTVGTFWRAFLYTLTLPPVYNSIHLLPVWEPGVVGSLYGIAGWGINPEFRSPELVGRFPHLETPERQLKALCNLLHLTGRTIGMDVIPHTDRFSEIVLANPFHFEWLQRDGLEIVDHSQDLHRTAENHVYAYLMEHGPAVDEVVPSKDRFFSGAVPEDRRNRLLFGPRDQLQYRIERRIGLVRRFHSVGLEPVPATMAPPFRGLEVDPDAATTDDFGMVWRDYRITHPQAMSRVFGPLTRYKLFDRKDDNRNWEIDFDRPREATWDYVTSHFDRIQDHYGFDFMRGDMAHVQMRPSGVPREPTDHYDVLRAIKRRIAQRAPYFAYFAETFLSPPDVMTYGNELDHLDASKAEVTLGDLQSVSPEDPDFSRTLRRYLDIAATRDVTPSFTVMTGDKDDPRFDRFYRNGNCARAFLSMFLVDVPGYTALGFELRDVHERPAANDYYTKLYVFKEKKGPKSVSGPYRFGRNAKLFAEITRLRALAEALLPRIRDGAVRWLLPPDPTGGEFVIAWTIEGIPERLVFVVNLAAQAMTRVHVPTDRKPYRLVFTVADSRDQERRAALTGGPATIGPFGIWIDRIAAGECRVYRID